MGRLILSILILTMLPSCAVLSTVAGAASTVVDSVAYLFQDRTQSLPVSMREALVGTQRSLKAMELPAALVEPMDDGYMLKFGNGKLTGDVQLVRQTGSLTAIGVTVHEGAFGRSSPVEAALFESIRQKLKQVGPSDQFDKRGYNIVLRQPKDGAELLGWYLPTAPLKVNTVSVKGGWHRIKMPSGRQGYLEAKAGQNGGVE